MSEDRLEFQQVYATFQPRIARYLAGLVGEADAPDLTQEVFVKVDRGLAGFRGESQLSTWIYRIATNAAYDKFRTAKFRAGRTQASLDALDGEVEDQDVWTGEEPDTVPRRLVREEMRACIRDYIDRLPESYRAVLVLADLEDVPNAEIAEILDISLATVKIRLHRGRAKLRTFLDAGCDFYQDERSGLSCEPKDALRGEPNA